MSEQTYTRIAQAVILVVFVLGTLYADPAASASTGGQPSAKRDERHFADCATLAGIARARGEAHHECDRQFILANLLDCSSLSGDDAHACGREREAVRACADKAGGDFFRCVREALRADPRH